MIKLLWRFALLILVVLAFTWLADRPGAVTVVWMGREIKTSVVAAVGFVLLGIVVLLFLWSVLRRLFRSPLATRQYFRDRRNRKGYESLSHGIIAAGAGDVAGAERHAAAAMKALKDEPLVAVLAAQSAQLKGNRSELRRIFEGMAAKPETEALGLRGLFTEARQAGDIAQAQAHAERALRANPRLAWASGAMLQLQSLRKDWTSAVATLKQQAKSGLLPVAESKRMQAALLAAQALELEDGEPKQALDLALKAHDLDPSLVPAAAVAARLFVRDGSQRKAQRVLQESWAHAPHPDLAEVMAHLRSGDSPEQRYERVQELVRRSPPSLEGDVALARAAVQAQRWEAARKLLAAHVEGQPQARVCALMADIEEGLGSKGGAREWMARALNAPRDPMWVSDGVAVPRWVPVSPTTGEIVPCLWKAPYEHTIAYVPESTAIVPVDEPIAPPETKAKPASTAPKAIVLPPLPDDPGLEDEENRPAKLPYADG